MKTRQAEPGDAGTIARIYNEGIEDRVATFDTELRTADDILGWLEEDYPLVVAEADGEVRAWAVAHPYSARAVYSGVGDYSVYVSRESRGRGLGRVTLAALVQECEARGYWKLLSRIFPGTRRAWRSPARSASARSASTGGTGSWTASGSIASSSSGCSAKRRAEFPRAEVWARLARGRELSRRDECERPERGAAVRSGEPRGGAGTTETRDVGRDDPSEETDAEEAPESQQAG